MKTTTATTRTFDDPGSVWHGAEIISQYTATQAVEDGVLYDALKIPTADASEIFRQQFNGQPVYLTAALYRLIEKAVENPRWGNDWAGISWDLVTMARAAVLAAHRNAVRHGSGSGNFLVIITGAGRRRNQYLTATLNGDGLTFSIQDED